MIKKILSILVLIVLILGMYANVNATELKTNLNIIQDASETKYLENDQGYISKKIVDSNSNAGEVTIELKLINKNKENNNNVYENTEVWIIVPELKNVDKKMQEKINFTMNMCNEILSKNSNVKIGIIGVKGPTKSGVNGTENDAEYVSELSNDYTFIQNNLNNMNSEKNSYLLNHQAGLRLASKSFSNNANKFLITLIDGITQTGIGIDNIVSSTIDEDLNQKATGVKSEMDKLKKENINFMVFRSENDNYIYTYSSGTKVDANKYIDMMYGTVDNPYVGKIYKVNDENIKKVIEEDICSDITSVMHNPINTVKVVDYFPEDITENFEFSYVGTPSVGTASNSIDLESKTITWDIGTLKGDEVATLKYKLKIKDMKNTQLLNKTISTNEKVVLTYKDSESKDYSVELTSSPKIQLSEVKEENDSNLSNDNTTPKQDTEKDNTTSKGNLPYTGANVTILVVSIIVVIGIALSFYKKYYSYKDIK